MQILRWGYLRMTAGMLASAMLLGIAGCGGRTINAQSNPPMNSAPMRAPVNDQPRQGMSTKQKVLLVAGAAALYYLYKKHQNAQGQGAEGKYYRSKNGQIYYRDAKGQPHWVTEPSQPIQVPADEYERYTGQRANNNGQVIRQAPANW